MRTQKLRDGGAEIVCSVPGTQLDPRDVKEAFGNSQTPPDMNKHHSAVERGDNQGVFKPVGDAGWPKDPECTT